MNKEEWIAEKGLDSWNRRIKQARDRYRRKHPKDTSVNDFSFKVHINTFFDAENHERLDICHKIMPQLQKDIRLWWKKQTEKPHIIVVDYGSKTVGKKRWSVKVSLTQLNLDENTMTAFKKGAISIIENFNYDDYQL